MSPVEALPLPVRDRLEGGLLALERRLGVGGSACVIALVLLAGAALYVAPSLHPVSNGKLFAQVSENPFDRSLENPVRFRILSPFLGWLLHLRGERFLFFPLLMAAVLLATVHAHYRRRGFSPGTSAGMAAILATSTPVLFTLYFAGYTDTTTYVLVFLCLALRRSVPAVGACYALALLNHESALFAAPWIGWAALAARPSRARAAAVLLALVVPVMLLVGARHLLSGSGRVVFDPTYYVRATNVGIVASCFPLGVFFAFKLLWVFVVLGVFHLIRGGRPGTALWCAVVILCSMAQVGVASDTSRLVALSFPAVLLGAEVVRERQGEEGFSRFLWGAVLWNLLIPQYYVGQSFAIPLHSVPVWLVYRLFGLPEARI